MNDRANGSTETTTRRFPWLPLGVVVVMFAFALFGNRGILHIFKLKRQQVDLEQQLAQVEEVNAGLRREIASLTSDRRHLERMARSQLGMVREDEIVYQFSSKAHSSPSTPSAATADSPR